MDARLAEQGIGVDIFAYGAPRLRVSLHEQAKRGRARQGFQPQRPRSGEQIHHPRARQLRREAGMFEDVEHGLTHAVRGRARISAFRRDNRPPLQTSGDNSHR